MILIALGSLLLLALVFGPSLWVRHVFNKHGADRHDLPGTGGELARHLLDEADLASVKVEATDLGDHYDPDARAVRLKRQHHDGKSITAVAVAAHEVAHAIQHAREEGAFMRRMKLVGQLIWIDRAATGILILTPVVFALVHSPALAVLQVVAAIGLLASHVVVHITTLPVEFDASFGKALPALHRGRYLSHRDLPGARRVLEAAAYTYIAAALATLLNVVRWFRFV